MRKAYVQADKQGNVISLAMNLPLTFKGQGKFNKLSDAQVAKYGWHKTNLDSFQGQLGQFKFDENFNVTMTDDVKKLFSRQYLESMQSVIWSSIAQGIEYNGYKYQYSYHHQMQIQNACIIGCNVTRYKNDTKEIHYLSTTEAKKILSKQVANMDHLKKEYNFYCEKITQGFNIPSDYTDLYKEFTSAMRNEI